MTNEPNHEQVAKMAKELKELLENYLLENSEIASPFMERAKKIRKELEQFGLLVTWMASLNPETMRLFVEINVFKPKENMTTEEQAVYDEWFLKRAGASLNTEN